MKMKRQKQPRADAAARGELRIRNPSEVRALSRATAEFICDDSSAPRLGEIIMFPIVVGNWRGDVADRLYSYSQTGLFHFSTI